LTKQLHEESQNALCIDDAKIEISPKTIDNSMIIGGSEIAHKPKSKMNVRMVKAKVPIKKTSRLAKATQDLYDLEDDHGPEKQLNIDFGLYQMEDY